MRILPRNILPLISPLILGLLGAYALHTGLYLPATLDDLASSMPVVRDAFESAGVDAMAATGRPALILFGTLCFAMLFVGMKRRRWVLWAIRGTCVAGYALLFAWSLAAFAVTGAIARSGKSIEGIELEEMAVYVFYLRFNVLDFSLLLLLALMLLHVLTYRRDAMREYSLQPQLGRALESDQPAWHGGESDATESGDEVAPVYPAGDRILESIRTGGSDPRYRRSVIGSVSLHLMVLVIIPWVLASYGCVENFLVPKGEFNAVQQMVMIIKPKPKAKKTFLLNPQSAISFYIPELDDSEIEEVVDKQSEVQYVADATRVLGQAKSGKGGKPGWPEGSDKAEFRFAQLAFRGEGWNDGLEDGTNAGRNFMDFFARETKFKTRANPEKIDIRDLPRFDPGYAPSFIYMTGSGRINMSSSEIDIIRKYVSEGGMIFADAGSREFHRYFTSLMNTMFPASPLRTIADDDPIFGIPYSFPNGAPPLWHHGGSQAQGVRLGNRWVVFYHPGDINDAWKDGGSGVSREIRERAFRLGVNIVYYAFTNYLRETRKYRK